MRQMRDEGDRAHLRTAPWEVAVLALRELRPRSAGGGNEWFACVAGGLRRSARRWFSQRENLHHTQLAQRGQCADAPDCDYGYDLDYDGD